MRSKEVRMKNLFVILLSLALLLAALPAALAEPAIAEPAPEIGAEAAAALPEAGDVVNGFEVVELREYPLMDAVIARFEHQKTGAQLFYIANDDTNRAFDMTFFTDAVDNTGLPHVFEHATTAGSRKYPSPAAWFNIEYQTYNTYWNAHTYKTMTSYPCASLSEAQLLKYADYFVDSCFNPTLMDSDDVLRTEGWRYRLDDAQGELTCEGTVYSEMLGAWTLQRVADLNALRAMFPGSIVGNDSGGDPDCIPDLTWEMLKEYHEKYYHPSNCAAYLYGQFEDYAAFLELLDGYFSVYEKAEIVHEDSGYAPIAEPVVQTLSFPVEQGSNTEHASTVYYGFVCPGLNRDADQERVVATLATLLRISSSDLQQSLQEVLPYGSFSVSIEQEGPEDAVIFVAQNVDPGDAEVFQKTVDDALREVAANGLPQDQVDGAMASLSTSALLIREDSDPVGSLILNMAYHYAVTGDPWGYQEYQDSLFALDDWNGQGLYARAVSDWLLGSRTTALVTTYPEPGGKEAKDAALREKLAGLKAAMSEEEIVGIVAASNAPVEQDDASDIVAQLQAVTVEELPEELKQYDVIDETDEDGVRHIDAVAGVDGIGEAIVMLDAAGLAQEDIHWFNLYTDLVFELDTTAHSRAELIKLASRYLYGGGIYLSIVRGEGDDWRPCLQLSWIAQDGDLEKGYDLMREILFDTKVDDPVKLLEQVQALKADMKSGITANPKSTMMRRALAITDEMYRYKTYAIDLEYYDFLVKTERQLAEDPNAVVAKLKGIQAYFNNRTNAVAIYAGNADSIALNRKLADAFLDSLDARPIERETYDLPVPAQSEALVIDSGAQYNLLMADYETLGLEDFDGRLEAVTNIVSDVFLFPLLRDQYGVYTPQHGMVQDGGVYIYAYRDPNIAETFEVLEELPELVADMELDQQTLDGYILSAYSGYAMPQGELSGALYAANQVLKGKPRDEALTWMRQLKQLTPETLKEYGAMYEKLAESGVRRTAGGAAAVNANADLCDAVLNPFGAVDRSQQSLTDVPEGSEHYDAVRFVFEEGFMLPVEDERFGVDEPSVCGDLLAAMYALIGGECDPNEALAAFVEYGLMDADADLRAPITADDVADLFSAVTGEEAPALKPGEITRGELAEALMAFALGAQAEEQQ